MEHTKVIAKLTVGFKLQVRLGVEHVPAWVPVKRAQSSGAILSFAFLCEYATKRDDQQQKRSHGSICNYPFLLGSLFVVRNNFVTAKEEKKNALRFLCEISKIQTA
jgi:hypothetical protein